MCQNDVKTASEALIARNVDNLKWAMDFIERYEKRYTCARMK